METILETIYHEGVIVCGPNCSERTNGCNKCLQITPANEEFVGLYDGDSYSYMFPTNKCPIFQMVGKFEVETTVKPVL